MPRFCEADNHELAADAFAIALHIRQEREMGHVAVEMEQRVAVLANRIIRSYPKPATPARSLKSDHALDKNIKLVERAIEKKARLSGLSNNTRGTHNGHMINTRFCTQCDKDTGHKGYYCMNCGAEVEHRLTIHRPLDHVGDRARMLEHQVTPVSRSRYKRAMIANRAARQQLAKERAEASRRKFERGSSATPATDKQGDS